MRTVQEIFDETIHLIDGQNESTGATLTSDTKEYAVLGTSWWMERFRYL